ncbi:MAG: putative toxin-antitoxin system toxin component, PIN family [Endomicrobium sp.]|jgi:putative PIN family toxin of toxin-antitoxin system|nr:putative toxin-antitoxin system toxin component, PIN family [Endomicrobium sp.]
MKIACDTNIFISAFYFGGSPKIILERAVEGIDTLYIAKEIIEEIFDVMSRPKFKTDIIYIEHFINFIQEIANNIRIKGNLNNISRDVDDNKILECALAAKVDYLITGDKDLLILNNFKSIKIISSEQYLKLFK